MTKPTIKARILTFFLTLCIVLSASPVSAVTAAAADFTPTPQTPYSQSFVNNCEGQAWFINEIERLLNAQQKSINTITSAADLNHIYTLGFAGHGGITTIPPAISQLTNLKHLFFSGNKLTSFQPEIFNLLHLETLDFSNNQLIGSIPTAISKLTNLKVLSLHANNLSGAIPAEITTLSKLTYLDLASNTLTGGIPSAIGSLKNLETFSAYNNQLTGSIPTQFNDCISLKAIIIWNNQFTGSIPNSFAALTKLQILDVAQNKLTGTLPTSLPISLRKFAARQNELTGGIPAEYNTLISLDTLDVYDNNLTGFIPPGLSALVNMEKLDLSKNQFSGKMPDIFSGMIKLKLAYLNDNKLVGHAPDSLYTRQQDGADIRTSSNYLTGSTMKQLRHNENNFTDGASSMQNRMALPAYIQTTASQPTNLYALFTHKNAQTSAETNKEKLPASGYELIVNMTAAQIDALCAYYEVTSLDDLIVIQTDATGIHITLLQEIEADHAIPLVLRIKHNDGSDYSQTAFWAGTDPAPVVIPPLPNPPPAPGGGGGGGGGGLRPQPTETIEAEEIPLGAAHHTHTQYISGYPDGTVGPDAYIAREEAALIFFRTLEAQGKTNFRATGTVYGDIASDRWSAQAIEYLSSIGILSGSPDGNFYPGLNMTRAEFATVVAHIQKLNAVSHTHLSDISGHWAEAYITSVANAGYIVGYPDGTFRPDQNIARSEAIVIVNKMLGRVPNRAELDMAGKNLWPDLPPDHWAYYEILEASIGHSFDRGENGTEIWRAVR